MVSNNKKHIQLTTMGFYKICRVYSVESWKFILWNPELIQKKQVIELEFGHKPNHFLGSN